MLTHTIELPTEKIKHAAQLFLAEQASIGGGTRLTAPDVEAALVAYLAHLALSELTCFTFGEEPTQPRVWREALKTVRQARAVGT